MKIILRVARVRPWFAISIDKLTYLLPVLLPVHKVFVVSIPLSEVPTSIERKPFCSRPSGISGASSCKVHCAIIDFLPSSEEAIIVARLQAYYGIDDFTEASCTDKRPSDGIRCPVGDGTTGNL